MLLHELASTSERVATTSARRGKISALAACLHALTPSELEIGVAFLSGEARQGRIGVGYAVLRAIDAPAAGEPALTVEEVDAELEQIAGLHGAGVGAKRAQRLHALFARATALEQAFLFKLLLGELRQGALEGV